FILMRSFVDTYLFIRVVGSIIVVAGLYGFLWGEKMETDDEDIKEKESTKVQVDLELQSHSSNGHHLQSKQMSSEAKAEL
ncbi:hypothetical protein HAX54_030359, partial [Datura stramonium]|nr:hypothetical protein [Datura stramonium]